MESLIAMAALVVIGYTIGSIKIINQGYAGLVERLGRHKRTLKPGLNFVLPVIDKVLVESTREQILDIAPQLIITKDGIPLEISVIVFWRILDIEKVYYGFDNIEESLNNIVRSSLRTEVSRLNLEEVFVARERINTALLAQLGYATETWGSKVIHVEIQDILLAKAVLGEVPDTIELTFYNGIDWTAFKYSFNLVIENEGIELGIQSIEDKGNGELAVRVKVPSDANKAQVYKDLVCNYEVTLQKLEARYQAQLQAKDDQLTIYRQQSADMKEIVSLLASRPVNVTNENKIMSNSNDQSRKINVARDLNLTGSNLNLGEINGTVTNTINQLPDAPPTDSLDLKQLLTELKDAIATDTDLPDTDKADLLEQVQNLAAAKQAEEPAQKEGLVRKAKKMFAATLNNLPDTAKLAEACSKLLPLILKALGFPA